MYIDILCLLNASSHTHILHVLFLFFCHFSLSSCWCIQFSFRYFLYIFNMKMLYKIVNFIILLKTCIKATFLSCQCSVGKVYNKFHYAQICFWNTVFTLCGSLHEIPISLYIYIYMCVCVYHYGKRLVPRKSRKFIIILDGIYIAICNNVKKKLTYRIAVRKNLTYRIVVRKPDIPHCSEKTWHTAL